jgi:predicted MFS family arabinose efflux permease
MVVSERTRTFILTSLALSTAAPLATTIVLNLLLVDIGITFGHSIGIVAQLETVSEIMTLLFALLIGALSVRVQSRSLLLTGLLFLSISALGCGFSSSLSVMVVFYSIKGVALSMAEPMTSTIVGEFFSLERRASAMGWILAGVKFFGIIGPPIVGFISGLWSWRSAFLGFLFPISFSSLLVAALVLPSRSKNPRDTESTKKMSLGYREVFKNKSAVACLIGASLSAASSPALGIYAASFFRQNFKVSVGDVSFLLTISSISFIIGSIVLSRFVNRFGRKLITAISVALVGVFIISYHITSNLQLSIMFFLFANMFQGLRLTSLNSLALEQIPKFRGTMMSLLTASFGVGVAVGTGVGGICLLSSGYPGLGLTLGFLVVSAAVIFHNLTVDPAHV